MRLAMRTAFSERVLSGATVALVAILAALLTGCRSHGQDGQDAASEAAPPRSDAASETWPSNDSGRDGAQLPPDSSSADSRATRQDAGQSSTCNLDTPCGEGSFCRLATGKCLPLQRPSCATSSDSACYGFKPFATPKSFDVSTCTQKAIQDAINQATAAGGGLVRINASKCPSIDICRLTVKSNVVLDGGGATLRIVGSEIDPPDLGIITNNWTAGPAQNMVIRNLTVDGSQPDDNGISTTGHYLATNVLIEHVEVNGAYRNSLDLQQCVRCTARYNRIYGSKDLASSYVAGHGFTTGYDTDPGTGAPFRTQIYSNELKDLRREDFYAFDVHRRSDSYEIAGNRAQNVMLGAKFVGGASNVLVHHNLFDGIAGCGLVTASDDDADRMRNVAFHYNTIRNTGTGSRAFCLCWGTEGVWQAENLELWYNELLNANDSEGCTTALMARMTGVSIKGSHGNICLRGSPVEWTCDADPPCDAVP